MFPYSWGLHERAPGSEVIFALSYPDKNVANSLVLAGLAAGLEVIFAFSYPYPDKYVAYSLVLTG